MSTAPKITSDQQRAADILRFIDERGPLLRGPDGEYHGPIKQNQPAVLHAAPAQVDRCIEAGYLEALANGDGLELVDITEKGRRLLVRVAAHDQR